MSTTQNPTEQAQGTQPPTEAKGQKAPYDPQDKYLRIAVKQQPRVCLTRARTILDKFKAVEISALGEATAKAVRAAENLQRQGVAKIDSIKTETHEDNEGSAQNNAKGRKKIKIIIALSSVAAGSN